MLELREKRILSHYVPLEEFLCCIYVYRETPVPLCFVEYWCATSLRLESVTFLAIFFDAPIVYYTAKRSGLDVMHGNLKRL